MRAGTDYPAGTPDKTGGNRLLGWEGCHDPMNN